MKWIEMKIKTTSEASDAVSEMLTGIGAGGVAIEDPEDIRREIEKAGSLDYADDQFMSNLGEDVIIKAYFPSTNSVAELAELIKEKLDFISNFLPVGEGYAGYSEIDEEDWATAWKKYYKPLHISERIVIKPSWEDYRSKDNEIIIELDPGMAFGTGTHETTRMCAQLLEKYIKPGDTVLDVGCGTGILAIIASKLGAADVAAFDIDEVAVRVTKENCLLNDVKNVQAFKAVLSEVERKRYNTVVANIIARVIVEISDLVPEFTVPGGYLITSGIIRERKDEVVEAYEKLGFTNETVLELGEWVAIVFRCPDSL